MNNSNIKPLNLQQRIMRLLPWLVKLGLSAGLIWYLLGKMGGHVVEHALAISPLLLCLALGLILIQGALAGIRWALVVSALGHHLLLSNAISITFVSLFFNQFLPASVGGDAIRMWQSKKAGLPLTTAVTSVMLERFGSLLSIATLSVVMLPVLARHLPNQIMSQGTILVAIAGLAMLGLLMFLDRLPSTWHRWRVIRGVGHLARDSRALFMHPRHACYLVLTALGGQLLLAAAVFSLAQGMKLSIGFTECLAIMPAVVIVSSLPISVAGWGVREIAMVTAFGFMGIEPDAAMALSVILALTGSIASLPGGILFAVYKLRIRQPQPWKPAQFLDDRT
jgi:hypothetical protein